jgi:lysozyme
VSWFDLVFERIKIHEGYRSKPYDDATGEEVKHPKGHLPIGYGWNFSARPMTVAQAEYMAVQHIVDCRRQVDQRLPWARDLPPEVYSVLVEMCYQMGIDGLMGFRKTLHHAELREFQQMAGAMRDSKWFREDTPTRAETLAAIVESI